MWPILNFGYSLVDNEHIPHTKFVMIPMANSYLTDNTHIHVLYNFTNHSSIPSFSLYHKVRNYQIYSPGQ